jgi:hypothetical protein
MTAAASTDNIGTCHTTLPNMPPFLGDDKHVFTTAVMSYNIRRPVGICFLLSP